MKHGVASSCLHSIPPMFLIADFIRDYNRLLWSQTETETELPIIILTPQHLLFGSPAHLMPIKCSPHCLPVSSGSQISGKWRKTEKKHKQNFRLMSLGRRMISLNGCNKKLTTFGAQRAVPWRQWYISPFSQPIRDLRISLSLAFSMQRRHSFGSQTKRTNPSETRRRELEKKVEMLKFNYGFSFWTCLIKIHTHTLRHISLQ